MKKEKEKNENAIYVCMTGSPKDFGFATKADFESKFGGILVDVSISSKECQYLITDDLTSTSSKMKTAQKKAFTALSFGITTTEFASRVEKVPNLTQIENTTTLGGGIPIKAGNETIGSIGIGGAPSGAIDEKIGNAALSRISNLLK